VSTAPQRLVVEGLVQLRGGRRLIDGLSVAVASGEALVLTGPNGSGKTTLLRTLAGLIPPHAGLVRLDGGDGDLTVGEQAHLVGHANAIKLVMTVAENVRFWARYLGGADDGRDALMRLDLDDLADIPAGYLSAGQKRRVGLARLLVAPRPIWLLDEPTASLDQANVERLALLMTAHRAAGGIVIAATHLPLGLDDAAALALDGAKPA
jgi:heme exporter protein A